MDSDVEIATNTVDGNSAPGYPGGGIYLESSNGNVHGNLIRVNGADEGGGICARATVAVMADNSLVGNAAKRGGGVGASDSTLTMTANSLAGNTANDQGGAGLRLLRTRASLTDNALVGNGGDSALGGGAEILESTVTASGDSFTSNFALMGGGVRSEDSTVNAVGWLVDGNSARVGGGGVYQIGGVLSTSDSTVTANTSPHSVSGAGIRCADGRLVLDSTVIMDNAVSGSEHQTVAGGGVYVVNTVGPSAFAARLEMSDCTVEDNSATDVGGGICLEGAQAEIASSTIVGNYSGAQGGGIQSFFGSNLTMWSTSLTSNRSGSGGGICSLDSIMNVTGSAIDANAATSTAAPQGVGGGAMVGRGTYSFVNCLLAGNSAARRGGALWADAGGEASLTNCTVTANSAPGTDFGGIVHEFGPGGYVHNSTVWGNEGGDLFCFTTTYSDVGTQTPPALPGGGNISADPKFVDAAVGDYRLAAGSPCVDEATSTAAPAVDILGAARPQGLGYDMGAFEQDPALYSLTYHLGAHGELAGDATQTVAYQSLGTTVCAKPDEGYQFVSWSDGATDAARRDAADQRSFEVTATFAINSYQLHYEADDGGGLSGVTSQTVEYGSEGTSVTAIAGTGRHFVSWSDGVLAAERRDTSVSADATYTASFASDTYQVHYLAGSGGTISGAASQTVQWGGVASPVTADPKTGYRFVRWSDGVTTATRQETAVTSDATYTASFAPVSYTLRYFAGTVGTISGAADQTVACGGSGSSVTAIPKAGFHFTKWSDGYGSATRRDRNVRASAAYAAQFAPNPVIPTTSNIYGLRFVPPSAVSLGVVVSPVAAPGRATIIRQRNMAGRWVPAGTVTVTLVKGRATYLFTPPFTGSWRFQVRYDGGAVGYTTYRASASAFKSLTIQP